MRVFRIAKKKHLKDLSGEGARLFGGRWNKPGTNILYTSESLALSVLELLVHIDYKFVNEDFGFIELDVPDSLTISTLKPSILKENWRENPPLSFTQDYGSNWINNQKNMVLKVPSAVLPNGFNYLLNPKHESFKLIKIVKTGNLELDARLV
ncbi:hypothetical protein PK35_02105 [Tamlana nanhaiensis]|uniref:RES domain-containing protein n=1 Tax=Neotamlana nanhaiensis TaxID=1382798 RepID=A0A0D7W727_9FLAO|nr:RES family NAD+ phosphorylase [Tamlana nanhaiensis]KJD34809.1 hypothetical protein PK35_02105 [Tamlana nanhaiensis]